MDIATITSRLGSTELVSFAGKHAELLAGSTVHAIAARAPVVHAAVADLQHAYDARRPLAALSHSATAAKNDAEAALEQAVGALSYDLLAPAALNKDRTRPEYRALFPDGTLSFMHGSERAFASHVEAMAAYLKAHADHPMHGRAGALLAKVHAFEAALAPTTAALAQLRAAEHVEDDKRTALRQALRKSVTFLRDQLDGDEKKVDALFGPAPPVHHREPAEPAAPATKPVAGSGG
jgi:hypothetical protein